MGVCWGGGIVKFYCCIGLVKVPGWYSIVTVRQSRTSVFDEPGRAGKRDGLVVHKHPSGHYAWLRGVRPHAKLCFAYVRPHPWPRFVAKPPLLPAAPPARFVYNFF